MKKGEVAFTGYILLLNKGAISWALVLVWNLCQCYELTVRPVGWANMTDVLVRWEIWTQ